MRIQKQNSNLNGILKEYIFSFIFPVVLVLFKICSKLIHQSTRIYLYKCIYVMLRVKFIGIQIDNYKSFKKTIIELI